MLHQIKDLMKDGEVLKALVPASNRAETIAVLLKEGLKRGYALDALAVNQALSELVPSRSRELTERELRFIVGNALDTQVHSARRSETCRAAAH